MASSSSSQPPQSWVCLACRSTARSFAVGSAGGVMRADSAQNILFGMPRCSDRSERISVFFNCSTRFHGNAPNGSRTRASEQLTHLVNDAPANRLGTFLPLSLSASRFLSVCASFQRPTPAAFSKSSAATAHGNVAESRSQVARGIRRDWNFAVGETVEQKAVTAAQLQIQSWF